MRVILIITLFFLIGCVDELDLSTDIALRVLVVEGNITTAQGPHYINLSRSAKYGTVFEDFSKKVEKALVRIRDQEGTQVILEEVSAGTYATPSSFRAKVGNSYTLVVETNDDRRYNSLPEEVRPVSPIGELSWQYKRLPTNVEAAYDHGVEIYTSFADAPNEQNYYLLKNSGTYLVETHPELHIRVVNGVEVPDPLDCCAICWVTEDDGDPELRAISDRDFDGNQTTQLAAYIQDDGHKYDDKYLIRIHQHSLTKEAFRFFEVLTDQLAISGDLFDPPPATLRGNMIDIDDPQSPVIGYFYASDVYTDSIYVERTFLQTPYLNPIYKNDCRTFNRSTTDRPQGW